MKMETLQTSIGKVESWQGERLGKITASEVWKIMKSGRGKEEYFSQTALSYIHEKMAELLTGEGTCEQFSSKAIEWGKDNEAQAVWSLAEKLCESMEYYGGQCPRFFPYNAYSGASPDALTKTHLIEIKCPYSSRIHLEHLLGALEEDPAEWLKKHRFEYYAQVQFGMLCTEKEKGLFVSYDPRMIQERQKLVLIEVSKEEAFTQELLERLKRASGIIGSALKKLEEVEEYLKY